MMLKLGEIGTFIVNVCQLQIFKLKAKMVNFTGISRSVVVVVVPLFECEWLTYVPLRYY